MKILIGGAWPYANGSLHIGHLSSLLGGDILARYYRLKGDTVCYVSGSDCHGTPITLRARKEGVSPGDISGRYHAEFSESFKRLGFSYDYYGHTDSDSHKAFVQDFFKALHNRGQLYEKEVAQTFCHRCNQFLPDRFVVGKCPHCGKDARGDQCDHCGSLLDPAQLLERRCAACGEEPSFKPSRHLFLPLSRFEEAIKAILENAVGWRQNAIGLTKRYLDEGLKDRAATRDIDWGVAVPVEGFEDKKIYVWVEAVLGYLSTCGAWCREKGLPFEDFWGAAQDDLIHYYIHGKDNIPFHTVILPSLLLAHGGLKLPDRIISSEYETLEGRKISTSGNWAVWVPYLLDHYHPDTIRYYFIANGPEKKDADFSWQEFYHSHNADLVGQFGNLVNRCLVFIQKSFGGKVPEGKPDHRICELISDTYGQCGLLIEQGAFRDALSQVFGLIRHANKYFDEQKPWVTIREDPAHCANTLYNCVQIIANLTVLLQPFIPFSLRNLNAQLNIENTEGEALAYHRNEVPQGNRWQPFHLPCGHPLSEPRVLFERLDKNQAEEEKKKLLGNP